MNSYINKKIYGLPKPLKKGSNTSPNKKRINQEYIHKVTIGYSVYFKVHIKRQGISKIKYFKTRKLAQTFVLMLKENSYF